jgi:SAM-dependent methyltransferase
MEHGKLEQFYESWSAKPLEDIEYDIAAAVRKADVLASHIPADLLQSVHSVLDFGCGYGGLLRRFRDVLSPTVRSAAGVDFSASAIELARRKFEDGSLRYHRLPGLDIDANSDLLRSIIPDGVDCILLVDLLEHVPDCIKLVSSLANFTKFFIVKLPVESSIFDNYCLTKEYPSSLHSNGHLREFDANDVHYFIRKLGLTPRFEALYVYHPDDIFPPLPRGCTFPRKMKRLILRTFKGVAAFLLPKKLFLRWVGGGGYICFASFDPAHVLNP